MRRWQVAVATENPKILYLVAKLLKRLKTRFVMCTPEDFKAYSAKIVVTTPEEGERIATQNQLLITEGFDPDLFSIELQSRLHDIENPRTAYIGIDPGMTYGIALVIQGCAVFQARHNSPHKTSLLVSKLLDYMASLFPESEATIRLGSGSRLFSFLILRELDGLSQPVPIEMVNEEYTTVSGGPEADIFSAIIIAGRSGRPVSDRDIVLDAKAGDIRALKSLASKITRGRKTLTSEEARSVIDGSLSLHTILDDSPIS